MTYAVSTVPRSFDSLALAQDDKLFVVPPIELVSTVEVLDPMILSSKVKDVSDCTCGETLAQIPSGIRSLFDEELVLSGDRRRLFVTLGQFSIVRLERDAQLVVPVLEYSIPCKECSDGLGCAEDPCEMFSRIPFPTTQFSPTGCDAPVENESSYQTC